VPEQPTEGRRYFSNNVGYGIGDALTLHGMLRLATPARVIEIGSGYSSAMTLDTVERFLDGQTELTFIEPHPELLESLLRPSDRKNVTIIPTPLQDVPMEKRTARFRCVLSLIAVKPPQAMLAGQLFEGTCEGIIAMAPAGVGGFGYDPLFIPRGQPGSMAELGSDVKNRISHRALALANMKKYLETLLLWG